ncbi:hypothetical protein JCM10213_005616 [Rhodosporidiobolus nylandii]
MALAYLGSWLPSFSSGPSAPQQEPSKQLTEEELNALHQEWVRMQASHQAQAESLLGKLVAENDELKARLEKTERELKDVKAGRREDEELLKRAGREVERLSGGNSGKLVPTLAVAVLDFEQDLFAPEVFHHPEAGRYAAEALHRKMRQSLLSLPEEQRAKTWQFLIFLPWARNGEFVQKLVSSGLIASVADLDDFINGFNRAHPLFMLIVSNASSEATLQRQRALATVFYRNPLCQRLIIGRWGLDLPLAEVLCPQKGADKVIFPEKVLFVEPYDGFYLLPQLRRRDPQIVEMEGVLRRFPLRAAVGGHGKAQKLQIDYSKPLWRQTPPICLDYYLSPPRCRDERCTFSHRYQIPPAVLDALRFELSRTPCPLLLGGFDCPSADACFFAHTCPQGELCPRRGCPFTAPSMHPRYVPRAPPVPHFQAGATPPQPANGLTPVPAPAKPPSTRSALERLLAGGSPKPAQAGSLPKVASPAKPSAIPLLPSPVKPLLLARPSPSTRSPSHPSQQKHSVPLASPFGHPLSIADAAEAAAAGHINLSDVAASMVDLSDEELAALLEKARKEEEEYQRGIGEDPMDGVPPSVEQAARQWQDINAAADDLVATLLERNQCLREELKVLKSAPPPQRAALSISSEERARREALVKEQDERLAELTAETERVVEDIKRIDLETAEKEKEAAEKERLVQQLEATAPPRPLVQRRRPGQPVLLTLIDASTAPFDEGSMQSGRTGGRDMGSRLRWMIEQDIREHDIELDVEDPSQEGARSAFLTFVFVNKDALFENLKANKVLKSRVTFDDFFGGFTQFGNNHVIDIGNQSVDEHIKDILGWLAPSPDTKRIYLAGINVEGLREVYPELKPSPSPWYRKVGPKLVLINHRDTDEQRDELAESGWRVTVFRRYFSSQNGLGGDLGWGWRFRSTTPPIGPGDANLEDGDDENGYQEVSVRPQGDTATTSGWKKQRKGKK